MTGCRVVGVAGGESKCRTAIDEGGFDACIDHRSPNLTRDLAAACPEGVDVYFENIGGNVLAAVLPLLNLHARIPLCGLLAQYNGDQVHAAPNLLPGFLDSILTRRLSVRGFIISDLMSRRPAFEAEMRRWVAEGRIRYREDITQGLENAPLAFLRMLGGHNLGKTLVQVS